ncbi:MAG: hypothetical protein EAZ15_05410 [Sphingobacteriales bacterium]|nr:MAG: hypothetical protein EAZ15_05410 [Sphingobacteriales bacterium]
MQLQIEVGFEQLVYLVKKLPEKQWNKLKNEVELNKDIQNNDENIKLLPLQDILSNKDQLNLEYQVNNVNALETFLLNAPTFTKKQLKDITHARKVINQWRAE